MRKSIRDLVIIALIVTLLAQSCAFEFEPDIPTIDWEGGTPHKFDEILQPAKEPYGWTCEGNGNVNYCRVKCPTGPDLRVCYELCVSGECGIYAMDDLNVAANVNAFIFAVHNWQEKVKELASKETAGDVLFIGVGTACVAATTTGLATAGKMLQQAPPTPEWIVGVGVAAFAISLGGCVLAGAKSIINSVSLPKIIEDEMMWLDDAFRYWAILRSCKECEE